jgi:hypothetical protein
MVGEEPRNKMRPQGCAQSGSRPSRPALLVRSGRRAAEHDALSGLPSNWDGILESQRTKIVPNHFPALLQLSHRCCGLEVSSCPALRACA